MTESQMDGGHNLGTDANANGSPSDNSGVQQPSFDSTELQKILDAVGTLSKRVDGLQSVKDKQAAELTGLKGQIAEYEKLKEKLGPEGALEQMELKRTLSEMKESLSKLTQVSGNTPGTGANGAVNVAQVIEEYGLDRNDPEVALLANNRYSSKLEVEAAIARYHKAKQAAPNPTPAQQPAAPGGKTTNLNSGELVAEYKRQMLAARGKPRELSSIREEFLQKGVNVHEVNF